jgi:hypothetical protein
MMNLTPPLRFLLRGSALVAALLTLWWVVPLNPLLFLLRHTAPVIGGVLWSGPSTLTITEIANGDWTFQVPLEATLPRTAANPAAQQIHSIDFDLARSDAGAFTFGVPAFWAVMLAAPRLRRNLRPLLLGTLAMALFETALVLITAQTLAHASLAHLLRSENPIEGWIFKFTEYLAVNSVPYLLPFAVALWLHRDLRGQIFYGKEMKVSRMQ